MTKEFFVAQVNEWGQRGVPFLFMIDFEMQKPMVFRIDQMDSEQILFNIQGFSNTNLPDERVPEKFQFESLPNSYDGYHQKFERIMHHLQYGDSFLTNLTVKTQVKISVSLRQLFWKSQARYKLWVKDQFLVFSPETFVQIKDGVIRSFPMKGTIEAYIPNAEQIILQDPKELAEHITIVDLIRNDLSRVASGVSVPRFRYVERIKTADKELLQISSEVIGKLPENYQSNIGSLLMELLPAGSVSGAPKEKTIKIIQETEVEKREYYTGVLGYFDGINLDSGVMIRFLEQDGDKFFYRSGGGITAQSKAELEYKEVLDKIYVPIV